MNIPEYIGKLFLSIDTKDTEKFLTYLSDDASFIFANYPVVAGRDNISQFLLGFFQSIKSLRHDIIGFYNVGDKSFVNGHVTYTRHDGSTLTVKFINIFTVSDNLINIYDIYMDASQLYQN